MHELATLPTSLRQRLELARSLMNDGRPNEAQDVLAKAAVELARAAPELSAAVLAAAIGAKGVTGRIVESHTTMEKRQYSFLGIFFHEEWVPATTTTEKEFDIRLRW